MTFPILISFIHKQTRLSQIKRTVPQTDLPVTFKNSTSNLSYTYKQEELQDDTEEVLWLMLQNIKKLR